MSATPINLNRIRKAKAKAERAKKAEQNRITHGRTKAERQAAKAKKDALSKRVDGHKLDSPDRVE